MSKPQDRTVYLREDGMWANKRNDSTRASTIHDTQKPAYKAASTMLAKQGGGEVTVMGVKGKIVAKNTIFPGKDRYPPKG
jgi:hypothetical protein